MAHTHPVKDADKHFIIDSVTRTISNANEVKNRIYKGDTGSEIFTFELPRYIDGHDMTLCNVIEIHYLNSGSQGSSPGIYEVKDIAELEENPGTLTFSWTLSGETSKYVGVLNFAIHFACTTNGVNDYVWNTGIHSGVQVLDTLYNSDVIYEESIDILNQWKAELIEEIGELGGGGTDAFVVTVSGNDEDGYESDKTLDEILSASSQGKKVIAHISDFPLADIPLLKTSIVMAEFGALFGTKYFHVIFQNLGELYISVTISDDCPWSYEYIPEKPTLNGVEISGDKTAADYGLKSEDFVVNVTGFVADSEKTTDKTFTEIQEAYSKGRTVYAVTDDPQYFILPMVGIDDYGASFMLSRGLLEVYLRINSNGVIIISRREQAPSMFVRGGIRAEAATEEDTIPVKYNSEDGKAYADLNIPKKTDEDTNYTQEIKQDPDTKKLYAPTPEQPLFATFTVTLKDIPKSDVQTMDLADLFTVENSSGVTFSELKEALQTGRTINTVLDYGENGLYINEYLAIYTEAIAGSIALMSSSHGNVEGAEVIAIRSNCHVGPIIGLVLVEDGTIEVIA